MRTLIKWNAGSAWSLGWIEGTDMRIERMRTIDQRLMFMVSDSEYTYLHCDSRRFNSMDELEEGIIQWAIDNGRLEYLH